MSNDLMAAYRYLPVVFAVVRILYFNKMRPNFAAYWLTPYGMKDLVNIQSGNEFVSDVILEE